MKLVNLKDYGINGVNHYWMRRDNYSLPYTLTTDELISVGVTDNDAFVDESLIAPIEMVNELLKPLGFEVIIKDAYRSKELYDLVRKKRYEVDGKEVTDKTLSTGSNPHSSGLAIDVGLMDLKTGEEVKMWNTPDDWPDGIFVDFYRSKKDEQSKKFQELQDLLIETMQKAGFKLGKRNEFHHFEYNGN